LFARSPAGDMRLVWAATGLWTVRPASDGATRPVPLSSQTGHCGCVRRVRAPRNLVHELYSFRRLPVCGVVRSRRPAHARARVLWSRWREARRTQGSSVHGCTVIEHAISVEYASSFPVHAHRAPSPRRWCSDSARRLFPARGGPARTVRTRHRSRATTSLAAECGSVCVTRGGIESRRAAEDVCVWLWRPRAYASSALRGNVHTQRLLRYCGAPAVWTATSCCAHLDCAGRLLVSPRPPARCCTIHGPRARVGTTCLRAHRHYVPAHARPARQIHGHRSTPRRPCRAGARCRHGGSTGKRERSGTRTNPCNIPRPDARWHCNWPAPATALPPQCHSAASWRGERGRSRRKPQRASRRS